MKAETKIKPKINFKKAENRVPRFVLPLVKLLIFAFDGVLTFACFTLAFVLREGYPIFSETAWAWSKFFVPYAGVVFFVVPIQLLMLSYQRVYRGFRNFINYRARILFHCGKLDLGWA